MTDRHKTQNDKQVRDLFQQTLPQAPVSPWFTRKVLNRLPERKRRYAGTIEISTCIVGIIATVVFAAKFVVSTLASDAITPSDIAIYAAYVAIFTALAANIVNWVGMRSIQRRKEMARMQ